MADPFLECQRDLLSMQRGVITWGQARRAGLTEKAIVTRLRAGRWQRLHPGVYATFTGELPRQALFWAAVLKAGSQAALSHQTAAELHGLLDAPAAAVHVTVPSGSRVARPRGVVIHYSGRLEQSRHPTASPPRTRIEDSVLDLAESAATLDEAVSLLLRAIASRRTTPGKLGSAMAGRRKMRRRAALSEALGPGREGAHSLLEFRYVNRVERPHGLPTGRRQRPVQRGRRRQYQDVDYEDYGLVVELDGEAAHPVWSRWADIRRDNASAALGQATLRYGWADVSGRACLTAREVAAALQRRGWEGTLRTCGRECQVRGAPGRFQV